MVFQEEDSIICYLLPIYPPVYAGNFSIPVLNSVALLAAFYALHRHI
jgi:hypothetical protein